MVYLSRGSSPLLILWTKPQEVYRQNKTCSSRFL